MAVKKETLYHVLKVQPRTEHEDPEGEYGYSSTLSSTSALNGSGWSTQAPAALPPGKIPGVPCTGRLIVNHTTVLAPTIP